MTHYLLTRQDIANILDMSLRFVSRNERKLNLHKAKVTLGTHRIRYRRDIALLELNKLGLVPDSAL